MSLSWTEKVTITPTERYEIKTIETDFYRRVTMRITENDKKQQVIILEKQEVTRLQQVQRILERLQRHTAGDVEKKAYEAFQPVADKWAPEPKKEDEKSDAKKS